MSPHPPSAKFVERCRSARCRSCGHAGLMPVLDLGPMPIAEEVRSEQELARPQARYPLDTACCPGCSLVQLLETLPPAALFHRDYPYYSSVSDALLAHSRRHVESLLARRHLGPQSLVVELASNDGYLLRNFVAAGVPVLGIDPSAGPAAAAEKVGVPTLCEFFTRELAESLVAEGRRADLVIANNVLAHVADTNGFVAGIARLLKPDGAAVIEVPWVTNLIDGLQFDTIYHEHLCYFSVTAAEALFRRHGLHLNQVEVVPIHGGSLRLTAEPREAAGSSVRTLLAEEQRLGVAGPQYYRSFADRVGAMASALRTLLSRLRSQGAHVAAYGAGAKGAILLNYVGLGPDTIEFVVDRNAHKHGKYMPGVDIPILPAEELLSRRPDYTLLLTWNFKDEILAQQHDYRARGGRFIVPVPSPQVV
jgi:SAM-dependent methyltransferase